MAEKKKGHLLLTEEDFVDVFDEDGKKLDYRVPKHWGPEELAAGVTTRAPAEVTEESAESGSSDNAGDDDAAGGPPAPGSDTSGNGAPSPFAPGPGN